MSNTIKYSEGSESLALNKGNWWIGTGDSNKGPTVESGYWNAINPPSDGYTVYLNKETNGPSIHSINNDENLISFTNKISGQNYTTVSECLVYYQTQDDKLCVNREYENIVTDGLMLNLDAGYVPSYPTSGTTWYDLSGNGNDGTLVNGPTFDSGNNGSIVFDAIDDFVSLTSFPLFNSVVTTGAWIYILGNHTGHGSAGTIFYHGGRYFQYRNDKRIASYWNGGYYYTPYNSISYNQWHHVVQVWDSPNATLKVFIDGILKLNQTISTSNKTSSSAAQIGMQNTNPDGLYARIFNGKMASIKLYNRPLSDDEVLQNYNAQKGRFGL